MAIATQDINLAKRKAFNYLSAGTKGDPFAFAVIDQLFRYLSSQGANPDLQFVAFEAADVTGGSGKIIADAACKVYAVYAKKAATNSTDSYLDMFDDAADDCDGATDARLVLPFLVASDGALYMKKDGLAMAAGVVLASYTDYDGTTKSAAADAQNGFVIIGNP